MNNILDYKIDTNEELIIANSDLRFSYDILYSNNIFSKDSPNLLSYGKKTEGSRRLIFFDDSLPIFIEDKFKKYFEKNKIEVKTARIVCSESSKDIQMLLNILSIIETFGIVRRGEPVIVVGGGVLMDAVSFATSIYRRGVPCIKIPTTLLGIVDASIGIKTSVNHFSRRNRLGSYSFPIAVIIDPSFLSTLPGIEFSNGLAEIIKLAIIKDSELFKILQKNQKELLDFNFYQKEIGKKIIIMSIQGMLDELISNPFEMNLKRLVDFGHTFSPVPEMRSLNDSSVPDLSHGTAVALDCLLSSAISVERKILPLDQLKEILSLFTKCKIVTNHPYFLNPDLLWESSRDLMRHRDGNLNLPLPLKIGSAFFCNDLTFNELINSINLLKNLNGNL